MLSDFPWRSHLTCFFLRGNVVMFCFQGRPRGYTPLAGATGVVHPPPRGGLHTRTRPPRGIRRSHAHGCEKVLEQFPDESDEYLFDTQTNYSPATFQPKLNKRFWETSGLQYTIFAYIYSANVATGATLWNHTAYHTTDMHSDLHANIDLETFPQSDIAL